MAVQVERRPFTVEEYDRLIEAGFFGPDERLELIDGEIVTMSPIGTRHSSCVVRLTDLFTQRLGMRALVSVQNPVVLGVRQEFQPDVAILRRRDDYYATRRPGPADAFLVIEVADTTFALDRSIKVPRYAAAGVPEVWLADLQRDLLLVFDTPESGGYAGSRVVRRGEDVTPHAFADLRLSFDDLFGPADPHA
jgi:Uma2 family endonuclease